MRGWKAKEEAFKARQQKKLDRQNIREIRRAHLEGREPVLAAPPEAVAIPDHWEDLGWPEMKSLASKVSDAPIKTKDDALTAIKAHLDGNVSSA